MPTLKELLNSQVEEPDEPKINVLKERIQEVLGVPRNLCYSNLKATLRIKVGNVFLKPVIATYLHGNNSTGVTWKYTGFQDGKKVTREIITPGSMDWEYDNGKPVFCVVDGSYVGKPMACASEWDNEDIGLYIHKCLSGQTVNSIHLENKGFVFERWMAVAAIFALLAIGGIMLGYQYLNPTIPVEIPPVTAKV